MSESDFEIDGRRIGRGAATYVVAELSANHAQQYDQALGLIHAAVESGADAVKLQTYRPETMVVETDPGAEDASEQSQRVGEGLPWTGTRLADLYAQAYMPWEWQPRLAAEARRLGVALFSSPFDATAVDFLEAMDCPAYKIASFELVDAPLLRRVAATGKPVILSTGMAYWDEVCEAVDVLRTSGCRQLALLKCVSCYPAQPEEMNLRNITHLEKVFSVPVGLSDHTLGSEAAIASVALGGAIVEKHLTLSRSAGGPDSTFSMEPAEFRQLVDSIRVVERALGREEYAVAPREASCRGLRRSLHLVKDVEPGELLRWGDVRAMRPASGIAPKYLDRVLTCRAARRLLRGTPLRWEMLDPAPSRV